MSSSIARARRAGKVAALPVRVGYRVGRVSARTGARSARLAVRSSLVAFLLGVGLGWFLGTPTGRYLVTSVRDAVSSAPPPPDDEALAAAVRSELASAGATWHLPQPEVVVDQGLVTLRGEVPHAVGRASMVRVADGVIGAVRVVDELTVTGE